VTKMRLLYRIGALVGAILLPAGAVLATGTPEASAETAYEYCFYQSLDSADACLNAWAGGPFVNVENDAGNNDANDLFAVMPGSSGNVVLQFDGVGPWGGKCIGDAYNEYSDARVSLDTCGGGGLSAGWGTQFKEVYVGATGPQGDCQDGGYAFKNNRWGGYLTPEYPVFPANGTPFYLNTPKIEGCFTLF
jgi:hypothetical protein